MVLGVYCAGGLGKEVVDLAKEINKERNFWQDILFVDDIYEGDEFYGHLVLSFEEFVKRSSEQSIEITIANGEPEVRRKLYERCKENNLSAATLVHPEAYISPSAIIGEGAIIRKYVSISSDVIIGENVYLQSYVGIGHDAVVGANSVLSSFIALPGYCRLDECVYIAPSVVVNNRVHIGAYAIIGMGSMVYRNVKEGKIIMGNPGKVIGDNTEKTVFHRF